MTDKEIAQEVIKLYEHAIKELSDIEDLGDWFLYLDEKEMDLGICHVINMQLGIEEKQQWVRKYAPNQDNFPEDLYWYPTPLDCETKEEIMDTLMSRLNRLKKILPEL